MMNENEANDKCFCSSEFSTAANRPYVVLTYTQNFSLNYANISIPEASTVTLAVTANPGGYPVTWNTNNSSVATVSASGVVTTHKSGTVTITASMVDADGVTQTATCTIYVYITRGVYYIQNLYSGYYLHVKSGGINNFTDVQQYMNYNDYEDEMPTNYRIRQMWRVSYLGSGRYSVRPLSKLDAGLDVTSDNVDIYYIGTDDTLSGVPSYAQWTIEWSTAGYVFKNDGDSEYTMQPENASAVLGKTVVASNYTGGIDCKWALEEIDDPPSGAYLYDKETSSIVSTATRTIDVGTSNTLDSLQLCPVVFTSTFLLQSFTWSSSNTSVATVNADGTVTSVSAGTAEITGRVYRGGAPHYVKFNVCVGFPVFFNTLIENGTLKANKLDATDDGLFLTTTPLSSILSSEGIHYLARTADGAKSWYVHHYYDDWYLFAVTRGSSTSYGLYKMREQETDSYDNNDPGVTISFIGLDISKLTACINNNTTANQYALSQALDKVTGPGAYEYDSIITAYFANTASDGPYLIAEKYVSFIANLTSSNTISTPANFTAIYEQIAEVDEILANHLLDTDAYLAMLQRKADLLRIPNALQNINNNAGKTVYNATNHALIIQDRNNLTIHEKQAILACFTADVTFNSFAAEVEFHAYAVNSWQNDVPFYGDDWYLAAIRADMAIGEENESGYYDEYYDLSSSLVQAQIHAHGEY